jgi:uncharacterized damage-inducible protein DinB
MAELDDLREHLSRYRAVTLQHFDILSDDDLAWRPRGQAFSCGQQLFHIISTEDFFVRGIFDGEWDLELLRFPKPMPPKALLRQHFGEVRARTDAHLTYMRASTLDETRRHGFAPIDASIRGWLWFILEHEIHHKAQLSEYLRTMGHLPPYFAMVLPLGERPDLQARTYLGGV